MADPSVIPDKDRWNRRWLFAWFNVLVCWAMVGLDKLDGSAALTFISSVTLFMVSGATYEYIKRIEK